MARLVFLPLANTGLMADEELLNPHHPSGKCLHVQMIRMSHQPSFNVDIAPNDLLMAGCWSILAGLDILCSCNCKACLFCFSFKQAQSMKSDQHVWLNARTDSTIC